VRDFSVEVENRDEADTDERNSEIGDFLLRICLGGGGGGTSSGTLPTDWRRYRYVIYQSGHRKILYKCINIIS
jgi:hypothetical protein